MKTTTTTTTIFSSTPHEILQQSVLMAINVWTATTLSYFTSYHHHHHSASFTTEQGGISGVLQGDTNMLTPYILSFSFSFSSSNSNSFSSLDNIALWLHLNKYKCSLYFHCVSLAHDPSHARTPALKGQCHPCPPASRSRPPLTAAATPLPITYWCVHEHILFF